MSFLSRISSNLQSVINYISNNKASNSNLGWNTYADAAGSQPVDGTGGSPTVTFNRDLTTPLREGADFLFVKDAANRQGQGVSYDFTIHNSDLNKSIIITADYEVVSGTFATGDLAFYIIQDPTGTPTVVQPSGYQVITGATGTKLRFTASFTSSSTITSYRLCIHVATTSASAYSLAFDRFSVGPQLAQAGVLLTNWQDFPSVAAGTLITTNGASNPTYSTVTYNKAQWRRVGTNMEIRWDFAQTGAGTAGAGTLYLFNLPSGYLIDTTRAQADTGTGFNNFIGASIGKFTFTSNGSSGIVGQGLVSPYDTSKLKVAFTGLDLFTNLYTEIWGPGTSFGFNTPNSVVFSIHASVPIQGWSTGV